MKGMTAKSNEKTEMLSVTESGVRGEMLKADECYEVKWISVTWNKKSKMLSVG